MTKKEFDEILKTCKRKKDLLALLPMIDTYKKSGSAILEQLYEFIKPFGYSLDYISDENIRKRWREHEKEEYYKNPKYCLECGKIIPFEKRYGNFCNQSCANSHSNKLRPSKSIEERLKISNGVRDALLSKNVILRNLYTAQTTYKLISECITEGLIENYLNILNYNDKAINIIRCKENICPICGKHYKTYLTYKGDLSNWKTCSFECKNKSMRKKISEKTLERIANGTFKGWQSRNILSYPEKFWINVLKNNNIEYYPNKPFKYDEIHNYFLDFYIEHNNRKIDLEIDGKLHKYEEHIISDKIRDERVLKANIEVYRIEWNEISSEEGSKKMKDKIDKFLEFYNQ